MTLGSCGFSCSVLRATAHFFLYISCKRSIWISFVPTEPLQVLPALLPQHTGPFGAMSVVAADIPADLKGDLTHLEEYGDEKQQAASDTEARGQDVDPAVEKKLVRKVSRAVYVCTSRVADFQLDRYIVPVIGGLYLFSALDRANLGNAVGLGLIGPRGLPADPHGKKYALFNAMFYVLYAICSKSRWHDGKKSRSDTRQ